MSDFDPLRSYRGTDNARDYDSVKLGDEADTVAVLHNLADGGRALELAIGTGRIALPLAESGVQVDGIEQSPDMIARLRTKPGADAVTLVEGDMADVGIDGQYELIYLVFNTLYNLITQDDQVRCFENVARHLTATGVFVVEAALPGPLYCLDDQYIHTKTVEMGQVRLDLARYDRTTQLLDECWITLTPNGVSLSPLLTRFVWPSEMDLMARIAGLRLHRRWGGWRYETFDRNSPRHVSVYGQ